MLVLPAVATTFTVDQVLADPIATNTALGHYTHFGNLLDLCAVVVPAGLTADGRPAASWCSGPRWPTTGCSPWRPVWPRAPHAGAIAMGPRRGPTTDSSSSSATTCPASRATPS